MKVIKNIENKYYPDQDERHAIRKALYQKDITLGELAGILNISYKTLWQKMTNVNGSYLTQVELNTIIKLTEIEFNLH